MIVHLDAGSAVPAYEQLRIQIAAAIASGRLTEGHQLPPIRQLAKDLDLAPGTVARAYRELEAADLVTSAGRRGTTVTGRRAIDHQDARWLRSAADRFAEVAAELDISADEAIHVVRGALAERAEQTPQSRAERRRSEDLDA